MVAEREFLKKATDQKNFVLIEKIHNKAKKRFLENQVECKKDRRKAA
jgi:hypothetical protein